MPAPRHRKAPEPRARRLRRTGGPLVAAAAVTAVAVGGSVLLHDVSSGRTTGAATDVTGSLHRAASHAPAASALSRRLSTSRSAQGAVIRPVPDPTGHEWASTDLNLYLSPRDGASVHAVAKSGHRLGVTGVHQGAFEQVVVHGHLRWAHAAYLTSTEPVSAMATGAAILTSAPCATGSAVESRIVADTIALHRAVCHAFPQVTEYGGWRPDGEHADGHALDIMVYGDSALGQEIADWVRANYTTLKVDDIIWQQHIWTPVRASEGWRLMPDRGSPTANHMDHVHVRVY